MEDENTELVEQEETSQSDRVHYKQPTAQVNPHPKSLLNRIKIRSHRSESGYIGKLPMNEWARCWR